ncbi:hypothetical protein Fmac_020488 [Flemingia macrophylla]|uniref:Secreted protein n=1 Tax=Flemingia macrophylla TaxID=520843 RepID=A0ABD1LU61_9FABA
MFFSFLPSLPFIHFLYSVFAFLRGGLVQPLLPLVPLLGVLLSERGRETQMEWWWEWGVAAEGERRKVPPFERRPCIKETEDKSRSEGGGMTPFGAPGWFGTAIATSGTFPWSDFH